MLALDDDLSLLCSIVVWLDVDMPVVLEGRNKVFGELLVAPESHCPVTTVDLDLLDESKTLATELSAAGSGFDASAPTVFIAEGLIMYLGAVGKLEAKHERLAAARGDSVGRALLRRGAGGAGIVSGVERRGAAWSR